MSVRGLLFGLQVTSRWLINTFLGRPWAISIEVTHNCTANCAHCDKGGFIRNEKQASPADYRRIYEQINPIVVQISGGEPLLRKDLVDIVSTLKSPGHLPYIVICTNASLLTEEIYDQLKDAGVDQFSISLDFPDERHDENRCLPGLFRHIDDLVPRLTARGNHDITVLTAVTRKNYPYLLENLRIVVGWDARLNLSMYTADRTGDRDLLITSSEDLASFRDALDQLIRAKRQGANVFSSMEVIDRYYAFFATGARADGCMAGIRSLVVNPDGSLCPCAMHMDKTFDTHRKMKKYFSRSNTCGQCFISQRASTEKPLREVIRDTWRDKSRN